MALSGNIGLEDGRIEQNESALITRARQGDELAWIEIVRQFQEPIFRLAYLILADVGEAEAIAQETFIRAYLSLDRFDTARPLSPWLLQIARNLARNRRRSLGRYWAAVQRWWLQKPAAAEAAGIGEGDEAHLLWQAVRRLPESAQEVIYCRYFLGLSEKETAVTLSVKKGTVKSRLHRALKRLEQVIATEYPKLRE